MAAFVETEDVCKVCVTYISHGVRGEVFRRQAWLARVEFLVIGTRRVVRLQMSEASECLCRRVFPVTSSSHLELVELEIPKAKRNEG